MLTSEEGLLTISKQLQVLFSQCVRVIVDSNPIRMIHALETMAVLFKHIFRKKFSNFGFDILHICGGGFERGDVIFKSMTANIVTLLRNDKLSVPEKSAAIALLSILVSGAENINQNSIIEYFYREDVFDALLGLFILAKDHSEANSSTLFGALFVCLSLINYQKYESARNPFTPRLADFHDAVGNRVLVDTLVHALQLCRQSSRAVIEERQKEAAQSILSKVLSSFWSSGDSGKAPPLSPEMLNARQGVALTILYEICHSNKDFFLRAFLEGHGWAWDQLQPGKRTIGAQSSSDSITQGKKPNAALQGQASLLREMLQLGSVLFLTVKDERSALHSKICLLSLTLLCEDESLLDCLHDERFAFNPPLITLRKSKTVPISAPPTDGGSSVLPPIVQLLDVLLEFLKNNVHNQLQVRLHWQCLAIFHRVLCYQKTNHLCLKRFKWDQLWKQMFRLLGFVSRDDWLRKAEVIELCELITTLFNMFITFGDTFLPSGTDYDFLYYELIRETRTISTLGDLIDKYAANSVLALQLENLRMIISHFKARIDQWTAANEGGTMTPEDVLGVIKRNYGSLKLTLLDNLDVFTPYMEQPTQVSFFRQLIRTVMIDYKPTASTL